MWEGLSSVLPAHVVSRIQLLTTVELTLFSVFSGLGQ